MLLMTYLSMVEGVDAPDDLPEHLEGVDAPDDLPEHGGSSGCS